MYLSYQSPPFKDRMLEASMYFNKAAVGEFVTSRIQEFYDIDVFLFINIH